MTERDSDATPARLDLGLGEGWHGLVQAASGGIGSALAERLLEDETPGLLWLTHRAPEPPPVLRRLVDRFGERVRPIHLDLLEPQTIERAAREIEDGGSELRLVLNASGFLHDADRGPERKLADLRSPALARAFAINASGPLLVIAAVESLLPRRGRVLVASLSARVGSIGDNRLGGWYAYRMSKAALDMAMRNAAIELRRRNRDSVVVALHPGTVDTRLSAPFQGGVEPERLFSPERAARQLLAVLAGLEPSATGGFYAWDGSAVPW